MTCRRVAAWESEEGGRTGEGGEKAEKEAVSDPFKVSSQIHAVFFARSASEEEGGQQGTETEPAIQSVCEQIRGPGRSPNRSAPNNGKPLTVSVTVSLTVSVTVS